MFSFRFAPKPAAVGARKPLKNLNPSALNLAKALVVLPGGRCAFAIVE
jgi:hypothetical protein